MFAPILNWVLGTGGRIAEVGSEIFGSVPVGRKLGEEILSAVPRRRQLVGEIEDLLIGLPREVRPELVGRTVLRFALYVVDLPASEKNHDAQEYGLFDHSLEVARAAVGELVRPSFRVSEDPAANYREQPVWAYAGFVLGLLHDVGKALEVDLKAAPGGETWNPLKEPLASFLGRHGRRTSIPDLRGWRPGRGRNDHAWKGRALFPLILSERALLLLGGRLSTLLDVFVRSYKEGSEDWRRGPEGRIVETVRRWDREIAKEEDGVQATKSSPAVRDSHKREEGHAVLRQEEAEPAGENATPDPEPSAADNLPSGKEKALPTEGAPSQPPRPEPAPSAPKPPRPQGEKPFPSVQKFSDHERRIQVELDPARLIQTIQGWVRAGGVNVSRNRPSAQLFVTPKYLWLRYPQAFENLLEGVGIHWSDRVGDLLQRALRALPQVEAFGPSGVLVPALPSPQSPKLAYFVRIRAVGFLPEAELALLGQWPYEMRIPAAVPAPSEGSRAG